LHLDKNGGFFHNPFQFQAGHDRVAKPNSIQTVYSLAELIRSVERQRDRFDVISFDLFDTLLVRRIHDPDLIKAPVAESIAESAAFPWTARRILRFRNGIEALHRRRAGHSGPDCEASYPAVMMDLLRRVFPDHSPDQHARDLARITEFELSLEAAVLVPRRGLPELLARLRQAGKKILVISDMYLPASHLSRLLERLGLADRIDRVFSSADTLRAKASGAAWPLIRAEMAISSDRWLHVGDNPISDGVRPAEAGLHAVVLRDPGERVRKSISREYAAISQTRPYWRGRLVQQWMLPLESENTPRAHLYNLGYAFFGPLYGAYLFHLAERCRHKKIRRLFFLSREGRTLFELWNDLRPWLPHSATLPPAVFLEASRSAMAPCACATDGLTPAFARIAFLPAGSRDARDLARIYGLNPTQMARWLARYHLQPDTPLSRFHPGWQADHNRRLDRMLEDPGFQADVRDGARPTHTALLHYLESLDFFGGGDVALADIGWLGTLQHYLFQAIRQRADKPRLHGVLFASAGNFPFPLGPDNLLEGFLFDRFRFEFSGSLVMMARPLFEESLRADQPGLLGYAPDPDGCRLIHRDPTDAVSRQESEQHRYYAPLQEGIRDAVRRFGPALRISGFNPADLRPWFHVLLNRHVAFPSTRDIRALRFKSHINDFSGGHQPRAAVLNATRGLWDLPVWQLHLPGIRWYHYLRHAVALLRQPPVAP